MEVFMLVLNQMLMMTLLILVGFFLRKKDIFPDKTDVAISKLETYIFLPALNIYTQINNCTVENFVNNSNLILYGLGLIIVAVAIAYPLSRVFIRNASKNAELQYRRNIYKYALTFGNYGFMGNFIVLGVWGDEVFFKYTMFTFFLAIVCSVWGLYILIPKNNKASLFQNLKKGLLAPPIISLFVGIVLGLFDLKTYVPEFVLNALESTSKCMGPAAMILAGVVIGGYDIKKLFADKKVYIVSFLRLIVLPAILVLALKLIGTSDEIIGLALIAFATPLGMNTIVYPAAYGGETKTGASMTIISSILAVVTIPLMYYIFIVLF